MYECIGDQLLHGDLGVEGRPYPEETVIDLLLGVVGLDRLTEFDHCTDKGDLEAAVGPDSVIFIEYLENDRMRRCIGSEDGGSPEQQCGTEFRYAIDGPETERRQQITIREVGENRVTPASARCEISEPVEFRGIEVLH